MPPARQSLGDGGKPVINTMPSPMQPPAPGGTPAKEPEDIFSNLERAQKGPMPARAGTPMMQVPASGGGIGRTIATVLVVVLIVVALGGGAFWFFLIRTQNQVPETQTIPTIPSNTATPPVPTGVTPTTNQGLSETSTPSEASSSVPSQPLPPPVTQPPEGVNIPPPTPVGAPPTTSTASSTSAEVDSDGDGLSDQRELQLGTDPHNPDTDGDGLSDGDEVLKYHTNPLLKDTDGDGYPDGEEVKNGYNPLGAGKCANPQCIP
jgi:hypothetical protein